MKNFDAVSFQNIKLIGEGDNYQNENCLCTDWCACFLLHILLGISATYFITDTSRHVLIMVLVVIVALCLVRFFLLSLIYFVWIIQRYSISLINHLPYLPVHMWFCLIVLYIFQINTLPHNISVLLDPLH